MFSSWDHTTARTAGKHDTKPQTWRRPLLVVHVVATVSLIGTDLGLLALGIASTRGAAPATVYPAASQVASWIIGPLVLIALGTGIVQALLLRYGLLRYWWVTIKLAVTVLFTGLVWFALIPRLAASAHSATAGETFSTAERLPLTIVPAMAVALLIGLVMLAFYKPGGRIRTPKAPDTPITEEILP